MGAEARRREGKVSGEVGETRVYSWGLQFITADDTVMLHSGMALL